MPPQSPSSNAPLGLLLEFSCMNLRQPSRRLPALKGPAAYCACASETLMANIAPAGSSFDLIPRLADTHYALIGEDHVPARP